MQTSRRILVVTLLIFSILFIITIPFTLPLKGNDTGKLPPRSESSVHKSIEKRWNSVDENESQQELPAIDRSTDFDDWLEDTNRVVSFSPTKHRDLLSFVALSQDHIRQTDASSAPLIFMLIFAVILVMGSNYKSYRRRQDE